MKSETVIIAGREWIMTEIPAPDYSKTVFRPHSFKFNYSSASVGDNSQDSKHEEATNDG